MPTIDNILSEFESLKDSGLNDQIELDVPNGTVSLNDVLEEWTHAQTAIADLRAYAIQQANAMNSVVPDFGLLISRVEAQAASSADDLQELGNEIEQLEDSIPTRIKEKLEEMGERVEALMDDVKEALVESLANVAEAAVEDWEQGLESVINEQIERFKEVGDAIQDRIVEALSLLKDDAEGELTDAIKDEARETLDSALSRLQQEVFDGIVTSQIQVQITSAMSPVLPALIAVRIVATSIKKALEILRMGF